MELTCTLGHDFDPLLERGWVAHQVVVLIDLKALFLLGNQWLGVFSDWVNNLQVSVDASDFLTLQKTLFGLEMMHQHHRGP